MYAIGNQPTPPPTPLTVNSVDPPDNALNILINKVINITFNKTVQHGTNYSKITLTNGSTKVGITTAITGNRLTITPTNALSRGMTYTVTIPRDAVKNGTSTLNANFISHFTTEPKNPAALTAAAPAAASVTKNFTISGKLSAGTTGIDSQTITLRRSTDNATWKNVTTAKTNATGGYAFSKKETAAGIYYYRTAYDGNDTYANATSNVVKINVNVAQMRLTLVASTTTVNQKVSFIAKLYR